MITSLTHCLPDIHAQPGVDARNYVRIDTSGSVDSYSAGSYTIIYTAFNAEGLKASATRYVTVQQPAQPQWQPEPQPPGGGDVDEDDTEADEFEEVHLLPRVHGQHPCLAPPQSPPSPATPRRRAQRTTWTMRSGRSARSA